MKAGKIAEAFVNSGSVLALSGSGMVATYSIIFNVPQSFQLLAIAFLLTISSYHINRVAEVKEDSITHSERTRFIERNKWLNMLAVILFLIAAGLALMKNILSFLLVLLPPIIVFFYSVKVTKKFKRLKEITLGKNVIVALTWTVMAFLTASYNNLPFLIPVFIMAGFIFIRFFINTVVFDMRDVKGDALFNVKTIPVLIGRKATRNLLLLVNTFAALFLFSAVFFAWLPFYAHFLNLITLYGYYFIWKSADEKMNQHFLCDVIVDGEYILWPFLLLLGKLLLNF